MADPDNDIVPEWIENIPDPDRLFMRVANGWLPSRILHPGIFRETGGAVSVDWEKYSTAEQTRYRARNPSQFGVIALVAGKVRKIEGLSVQHEPIKSNRAHSGIHGLTISQTLPPEESKTKKRSDLFATIEQGGWEIDPFQYIE
jgi:hypothetical protein